MKYIPDAKQMKEADQYTIQTLGVPSLELMENAAESCVRMIFDKQLDLSNVCIVCGSGNNGGDGFAIARLLANEGIKSKVFMTGNKDRCTKETLFQIQQLENKGIKIENSFMVENYSIVIDAIFGVGLSRKIEGSYKELIDQMNQIPATKIAVDIPSGICANNGEVLGTAFKADYTITFQAAKLGHLFYPGKEYTGELIIKDIGISESYFEENLSVAIRYDELEYKKFLPVRKENSHKGTYGKLLIIAGSSGMSGAAYFNAYAAYMSGAGLVQIYTAEENRVILQQMLPEAIISCYSDYNELQLKKLVTWADTICIGSGLGTNSVSQKILKYVVTECEVPCVIDADGLNILSEHKWYLEKIRHTNFVLTPHLKEMSRLTGISVNDIKEMKMSVLNDFTDKYHLCCVLKDSVTVIKQHEERLIVNCSGNCAMAKAGSGDVLAGIIAGLLVQTKSCYNAAVYGTYIHGKCGDEARKEKGSYSVLARDLIEKLSVVLKREEG